jgi:hypothetical protein
MTEAEAKTKWCPFVRYLAIFRAEDGSRECAGSYNRGAQDSSGGNARCLGPECMMWRETMPLTKEVAKGEEPGADWEPDGAPKYDGGTGEPISRRWRKRQFFCGLAIPPGPRP